MTAGRPRVGAAAIHFTGAAGNVAAGKYNDGDPARRAELAGYVLGLVVLLLQKV
jgi:hypothetical protein